MKAFTLSCVIAGYLGTQTVRAAEFFVSKSGSDNNSCEAAKNAATPKLTIKSALGCESAGDTISIGDGTYEEGSFGAMIAPGTSVDKRTTLRAINRRKVIIKPNSGVQVVLLSGKPFLSFIGIVLDGEKATNNPLKIENNSHSIYLDDVEIRNSHTVGLLVHSSPKGVLKNSRLHHNGDHNLEHGMYLSTGSDDWVIEHNEFDHNGQMGIQLFKQPKRTTFRFNFLHDNCQNPPDGGSELSVNHESHLIERNTIWVTGSCYVGIYIGWAAPKKNTFHNNTIYCSGGPCNVGLKIDADNPTDTVAKNNIILGFDTGILNNGTNTTLASNLTEGNPADVFVNAADGDFRLKPGSPAIDAGTDVGLPHCGAAPDQGALEVCNDGDGAPSAPTNLAVQ